jgi:hypothetical protein
MVPLVHWTNGERRLHPPTAGARITNHGPGRPADNTMVSARGRGRLAITLPGLAERPHLHARKRKQASAMSYKSPSAKRRAVYNAQRRKQREAYKLHGQRERTRASQLAQRSKAARLVAAVEVPSDGAPVRKGELFDRHGRVL